MQPSFPFNNNINNNNGPSRRIPQLPLQQQPTPQNDFLNTLSYLTAISSHQHLSPLSTLILQEQALTASLLMQSRNTTAAFTGEEKEDSRQEKPKRRDLITHPLLNDVLFGRGRPLQAHHGNLRFHKICNKFREAYKNARKDDKAAVTATVLAEVSTPDPPTRFAATASNPPLSTAPTKSTAQQGQDIETMTTTEPQDQDAVTTTTTTQQDKPSDTAASATASSSSTKDTAAFAQDDGRNRGGRFLKRTDSGNHWIEVSTTEAMEKASHALRGLPRRSEPGAASIPSTTPSSHSASPSSTSATSGVRRKKDVDSPSPFPKKMKRFSKSSQQGSEPTSNAMAAAAAAAAAASSQMNLSRSSIVSQGDSSAAIRRALEALTGASSSSSFPSPLAAPANNLTNLTPQQIAIALVQQQQLQHQLQQYLVSQQQQQQQQHQQQERQALLEQARREIERQMALEMVTNQIVERQQQEQALRQLLLQRQQQQQALANPQLSQLLALQEPSANNNSSLLASLLHGGSGLVPQPQQQQQQLLLQQLPSVAGTTTSSQESILQQFLLRAAGANLTRPPNNNNPGSTDGSNQDFKPPAR